MLKDVSFGRKVELFGHFSGLVDQYIGPINIKVYNCQSKTIIYFKFKRQQYIMFNSEN